MSYAYRWWYALFIHGAVLILGFMYQTHPLFISYQDLQNEKTELSQTITQLKLSAKQKKSEDHSIYSLAKNEHIEWQLMSQLSSDSHQFGVQIKSIDFSKKNMGFNLIHIVAEADYAGFLSWLDGILNQSSSLFLTDFLYQLNSKNELIFDLSFLMVAKNEITLKRQIKKIAAISSPFCAALDSGKSQMSWTVTGI